MNKIKGWSRRIDKVLYGSVWANRFTYKIKNNVIGIVTKNPFTNKYEVLASDFINYKYIKDGFNKLKDARNFILEYKKIYMRSYINQ